MLLISGGQTHVCTDGKKSPNNCSNLPPPMLCGAGYRIVIGTHIITLPAGLVAQLVEQHTGDVKVWVRFPPKS